MERILLQILNLSIPAGFIIMVVVILRLFLKRAPRFFTCLLWGIVAIRLICPFTVESKISIVPWSNPIPIHNEYLSKTDETLISHGEGIVLTEGQASVIAGNHDNRIFAEPGSDETAALAIGNNEAAVLASGNSEAAALVSGNSRTALLDLAKEINDFIISKVHILSLIWIVGVLIFMAYGGITYVSLRKKVSEAIPYGDNIYICDNIASPFILGTLSPRIYLPSSIDGADINHVVAHEMVHMRRKDYIWKMLAFILLAVYWFTPFVWAAYILFSKDIEIACDERVISDMKPEEKKAYAVTLLSCSVHKKVVFTYLLHFGETGVKERVRAMKKYKKPSILVSAAGLLFCAVAAVCLLTNPVIDNKDGAGKSEIVYAATSDNVYNTENEELGSERQTEYKTEPGSELHSEQQTEPRLGLQTEQQTKPGLELHSEQQTEPGCEPVEDTEYFGNLQGYEFDGCRVEPRWYVYDGLVLFFAYDVIDWEGEAPDIDVSASIGNAYISDYCIKKTEDTVIMQTLIVCPYFNPSIDIILSASGSNSMEEDSLGDSLAKYRISVGMTEGKTAVLKDTDCIAYISSVREGIHIKHIDISNSAISFTADASEKNIAMDSIGWKITAITKDGREMLISNMQEPLVLCDGTNIHYSFLTGELKPEDIAEIIISTADGSDTSIIIE